MNKAKLMLLAFAFTAAILSAQPVDASSLDQESVLSANGGPLSAFLSHFAVKTQSASYRQIYGMLARSFREGIPEEEFVRLVKPEWRILRIDPLNYRYSEKTCTVIVRVLEKDAKAETLSFTALYLLKTETGWVLQNFPFHKSGVPEFTTEPECLRNGF